jgi:hypothetical protein
MKLAADRKMVIFISKENLEKGGFSQLLNFKLILTMNSDLNKNTSFHDFSKDQSGICLFLTQIFQSSLNFVRLLAIYLKLTK